MSSKKGGDHKTVQSLLLWLLPNYIYKMKNVLFSGMDMLSSFNTPYLLYPTTISDRSKKHKAKKICEEPINIFGLIHDSHKQ
jgi:hypothetical protein